MYSSSRSGKPELLRCTDKRTANSISRRDIVETILGLGVLTASAGLLPGHAFGAATARGSDEVSHPLVAASAEFSAPDKVDLEIVALGEAVKSANPAIAADLAAAARVSAGIPANGEVRWGEAKRAQELLTQPERIQRELRDNEFIFVEGWLLTHSEAGAALLFAEAHASSLSQ